MRYYPIKIPKIFKFIFNKWTWNFSSQKKEIYLTFDDGPLPVITPWVLEQLNIHNAKATFFCIGENIHKHPEVFQKVISENHSIGNHTYHHLNGWKTKDVDYIKNVRSTEKLLSNQSQRLFRPPFGKIKISQSRKLRELGYQIVMWEVLSADFDQKLSARECVENVLKNVKNGSIVVFHDSEKSFPRLKESLPIILKTLKDNGYVCKAIP